MQSGSVVNSCKQGISLNFCWHNVEMGQNMCRNLISEVVSVNCG